MTGTGVDYRRLSLWHETTPTDWTPRPALEDEVAADVAIVGAGFTGLWTAYYLTQAEPSLRVVVVEAEVAGFGASGRNGGWCSALFPTPWRVLVRDSSPAEALRLHRTMADTVTEVGRVVAEEGIDAHFHRGGTVTLARSAAQSARLHDEIRTARERGFTEDDLRPLDRDEARSMIAASDVVGGLFTPHCAAIHPARLVRGLARVVEERGVHLFEQTRVTQVRPRAALTDLGTVAADVVVRATEGYTPTLPGARRSVAPVYSLMVATAPLPAATWETIGLADRPTFSDGRHVIVYGQRTADGRIAFGGRGAPYHFGSRVRASQDEEPRVFAMLRRTLTELLPQLGEVETTHAWGGPLGIARDWAASVGLDRTTGLAWAGGYVGDGVGTSNLAGRTLADLVLERDTALVSLPWVDHRSRRWEPEPLRWIGINAGLRAMQVADWEEARTGRPSRIARAMAPLIHG